MLNSLSGRFLILTAAFVLLAEALILVPSVARSRLDYLELRLEAAQIASLARLAAPTDELDAVARARALGERGRLQRRAAAGRGADAGALLPHRDADPRHLRPARHLGADADPRRAGDPHGPRGPDHPRHRPARARGGQLIEVTLDQAPLRRAMIEDGVRVLTLSAVLVILLAGLLFAAVRVLIMKPIEGVVGAMRAYAAAPEDARPRDAPPPRCASCARPRRRWPPCRRSSRRRCARRTASPRWAKGWPRSATTCRNILASAQLFADRLEDTEDPTVRRLGPKIVASLSRAISLARIDARLRPRVREPPPRLGARDAGRRWWPR